MRPVTGRFTDASAGKKALVADFKDLRRPGVPNWAFWFGLALDDSVLTMRDLGTQEIYAFDVLP